jgi:hypothetical protein
MSGVLAGVLSKNMAAPTYSKACGADVSGVSNNLNLKNRKMI